MATQECGDDGQEPSPTSASQALRQHLLEEKTNEHTFQLRVTLWGMLPGGEQGWINYGPIDFDTSSSAVEAPYNAIQACLHLHERTDDQNRAFYIWPGPEHSAPICSGATLRARVKSLLLSGCTWAHISIKPGEPRRLGLDESGRFILQEEHRFKRAAPVASLHDAVFPKRARRGDEARIDPLPPFSRPALLAATLGCTTAPQSGEKMPGAQASSVAGGVQTDPTLPASPTAQRPAGAHVSAPSNKDEPHRESHHESPCESSSPQSSVVETGNNEDIDDAGARAVSLNVAGGLDVQDHISISSDDEVISASPHPLQPRTRPNDIYLQKILDAQAEAIAAGERGEEDELTDDERADRQPSDRKGKDDDRSRVEKARLTAKMELDVVDRETARYMERIDRDDWLRACAFWGVDQTTFMQGQPIDLQYTFWDLAKPASPAQLHEAWSLYMQETTECNGGILANMMGMGKTRTMVLMLVVGHAHLVNWLAVMAEWRSVAGPKAHLPRTAQPGSRCPTADDRPFACSCEPGSDFNRTSPRIAPTYLSGAGRSTKAWVSEIAMNVLGSKWCDGEQTQPPMRFSWLANPDLIDESPEVKHDLRKLEPSEVREMRCKIDYKQALRSFQASHDWTRSYKTNGQEHTEIPVWAYENGAPENHPDAAKNRPSPSAGRFILIVNYAGIQPQFQEITSVSIKIVRQVHHNQSLKRETRSLSIPGMQVVIGRTILDEFHLAKSPTTLMSKIYQKLRESGNHRYQWKSWALSGTPLEAGLAEVLTFVSLALPGIPTKRHPNGNWKDRQGKWNHEEYARLANASGKTPPLDAPGLRLAKAWTALLTRCGSNRMAADKAMTSKEYRVLVGFGPWILKKWVFWRTWETKDPWGHRVGGIDSDFDTCFQPCRLPRSHNGLGYEDYIARVSAMALRDVPGYAGHTYPRHLASTFASFPYLAVVAANVHEALNAMRLRMLVSIIDTLVDDKNPFLKHLDLLLGTSSKYEFVRRECNNVKRDRQDPNKGAMKKRSKILVGSCKPVCQMLLYLGLSREFGLESVTYLPGGVVATESSERIRKWRKPDGPWILVASIQAYAESVTFVEAHTVIMLEPQNRMNQQLQFACRILRKGQQVKLCRGFILYNPEAGNEQRLLMKQLVKTRASASLTATGDANGDLLMDEEDWDWASNAAVSWRIPGVPLPGL